MDDDSDELQFQEEEIDEEEEEKKLIFKMDDLEIDKNSICDSYICVFVILFIESLISLFCFYLFYL